MKIIILLRLQTPLKRIYYYIPKMITKSNFMIYFGRFCYQSHIL